MFRVQARLLTGERLRFSGDRYRSMIGLRTSVIREVEEEMVRLLYEFCTIENCHVKGVFYKAPLILSEQLHAKFGRRFSAHEIQARIMQLRKKFVDFRKFIKREDVIFDGVTKTVVCKESYDKTTSSSQEPIEHIDFRTNGCPGYQFLRYIFITCKASLFDDEPDYLQEERIERRESDGEDSGSSDDEDDDSMSVNFQGVDEDEFEA